MTTEVFWVPGRWSGRLGVMSRPRGGDWLEDEIRSWRRAGIDVVVSLLTLDEVTEIDLSKERELCNAHGIQFNSFPVTDRGVPSSRDDFSDLLLKLADELREGKTIAVHCRQGIGRAAMIAIGLLVMANLDPDTAIQRVTAARGCPVPETAEQRRWILDFAKSLAVRSTASQARTG